ncbi:MAG: hypothetical protein WAW36_01115 [Methylovulum miyakonense]|uniref:hypothetical protein n=1 Tax=Methylovulum miyakonense TaxID=645578 RepID=UPI003BB7F918
MTQAGMEDIELDLTRTTTAPADLVLDLGGGWKQTEVVEQFGLVETGVSPIAPTSAVLPTREEFGVAKLAEELGYNDTLTVGALEDGIRFYQQRTAECCLELGKRLLLLKELSMHGEFKPRVELLGFNYRAAARFMSAARRFTKSDKLSLLISNSHSQSKLLELLVLDDGDLDEIASGGEASGVTLDEIECMTATELRRQLRQYKEGKLSDEKAKPLTDKIASLEKQLENHEKVYEKQQAELEDKDRKLKQLTRTKQPGKEAFSIETMAVREEAHALEYSATTYIKALDALASKTMMDMSPSGDEYALRMESLGIATASLMLVVDALYQKLHASLGDNMPPEMHGKHVLTDLELQRLADCKLMIDHDFAVKAAGRESRRADEYKKPAGRPEGAKNKLK